MAEFNLFIPLTKADAKRRLVYGVVTAEAPDRGNEICDYATTKPYYQKWSAEFLKASGGKSLGNLRAMHGKVAAGRLEAINFNDDARQIEICAKIVDDAEWRKVEAGVYTGFSQGGGYVRRWPDANDPSLTRYTANPSEISLVDLPALPNATFSLVKADGAVETQGFAARENASEVEQVWMAQDGKTFKKKAEALAHQMALASMGPMLGALARAESDVDGVRLVSRKRSERDKLAKLLSEQALDAARAVAALEIVFDILNNALDEEDDASEEISALAQAIDNLKHSSPLSFWRRTSRWRKAREAETWPRRWRRRGSNATRSGRCSRSSRHDWRSSLRASRRSAASRCRRPCSPEPARSRRARRRRLTISPRRWPK
jgi:hypothetical protein